MRIKVIKPQYMNADFCNLEAVKDKIKSMLPVGKDTDILLYGDDIGFYQSLGRVVRTQELLSNYKFLEDCKGKI